MNNHGSTDVQSMHKGQVTSHDQLIDTYKIKFYMSSGLGRFSVNAGKWMELEKSILSEVTHIQKNTLCALTCAWTLPIYRTDMVQSKTQRR